MTDEMPPWEPPIAGTEAEHLLGSLDRLRATFRWKADGLDSAGLNLTIGKSNLTLGGLLKHLAYVEDDCSTRRLTGESRGEPWISVDWKERPDWEFETAATDSPEELYALYDGAVRRCRERMAAALANAGPEQEIHLTWPDGRHASLRRLLCDVIEEYGRHTGHADLIREAVDGRVGEDPDPSWAPPS